MDEIKFNSHVYSKLSETSDHLPWLKVKMRIRLMNPVDICERIAIAWTPFGAILA